MGGRAVGVCGITEFDCTLGRSKHCRIDVGTRLIWQTPDVGRNSLWVWGGGFGRRLPSLRDPRKSVWTEDAVEFLMKANDIMVRLAIRDTIVGPLTAQVIIKGPTNACERNYDHAEKNSGIGKH